MEKVVRQLEDLQNSQQAILEKISNIEVENIEIGDKRLETLLPEIHQRSADNLDVVRDLVEEFAAKTSEFGETNNVARLREQQEINSTK